MVPSVIYNKGYKKNYASGEAGGGQEISANQRSKLLKRSICVSTLAIACLVSQTPECCLLIFVLSLKSSHSNRGRHIRSSPANLLLLNRYVLVHRLKLHD